MPLRGTCNQCGACCMLVAENGDLLHCMNLMLVDGGKYGEPGATWCSAYRSRIPDMPVYMVDKHNRLRGHTTCSGDGSEKELNDLIAKGLLEKGSPCSLELKE